MTSKFRNRLRAGAAVIVALAATPVFAAEAAVEAATDAALGAWLQQHGTGAVLLRPDRYIAGLADDAAALHALTVSLPWLKPPPRA